jgi:tetratricopeptide (TPR) repeat protein
VKLWAFRAVLAGTPFLLLLVVEGVLRLFPGMGHPPLLLTLARSGTDVLRGTNAIYPERFFQEQYEGALVASGRMKAEPYLDVGHEATFRVVVAGASTVQGYPHPHRLSAPAFLQAMLADVLPGQRVEVFNLGITSIASFAVARTVEAAMALDPDVVIIYSGHNEFYGIYGAGSGTSGWATRSHYALMSWRLPRLLKSMMGWFGGTRVSSEQLLETMARRGEIGLADGRRDSAAEQLAKNLTEAVTACRMNGVKPVLCTLASNEEEFAPAGSAMPDRSTTDGNTWWEHIEAARLALRQEGEASADTALSRIVAAESLFSDAAWLSFLKGRALRRLGRDSEANDAFTKARNLDTMPWRAPAGHNQSIRGVARGLAVDLADIEEAFAIAAGPRRPGFDLMVDHVHPTVRGQVLLARTLTRTLTRALTVGQDMGRLKTDAEYVRQQGFVPAEGVRVDQAMAELLGSPPMDRYNRDAAQRFGQRAAEGWRALSPAEQRGAQRWMSHRQEVPLALELADELYADGYFDHALRHYRAARLEAPFTPRADLWSAVQLGWCARLTRTHPEEIEEELAQALDRARFVELAPGVDPAYVHFIRGSLHHFLGDAGPALEELEKAFEADGFRQPFLFSLFPLLAEELVAAGRSEDARRFAALAAADTGGNPYFEQLVESFRRETQ